MIEFSNEQELFEVTDQIKRIIETAVSEVIKQEGFDKTYEVNVVFTDDQCIRIINNTHRKIDKATDVLSFPMLEYRNGRRLDDAIEEDINPETGDTLLGDIVLSMERAKAQSEEYGHSFEREIGFLTVHSMLHLLGYDHEDSRDAGLMRSREEAVLTDMGLCR